jgi:hypothetical protein
MRRSISAIMTRGVSLPRRRWETGPGPFRLHWLQLQSRCSSGRRYRNFASGHPFGRALLIQLITPGGCKRRKSRICRDVVLTLARVADLHMDSRVAASRAMRPSGKPQRGLN